VTVAVVEAEVEVLAAVAVVEAEAVLAAVVVVELLQAGRVQVLLSACRAAAMAVELLQD